MEVVNENEDVDISENEVEDITDGMAERGSLSSIE